MVTELVKTYTEAAAGKPELASKFGKLITGAKAVGYIPDYITGSVSLEFLATDADDRENFESGLRHCVDKDIAFDGNALHGLDEKKIMSSAEYVAAKLQNDPATGYKFAAPTPYLAD